MKKKEDDRHSNFQRKRDVEKEKAPPGSPRFSGKKGKKGVSPLRKRGEKQVKGRKGEPTSNAFGGKERAPNSLAT